MRKVIFGFIIGVIFLGGFSVYGMGKVIPKRTEMQRVGEGAYCWTPDGKVAFYRRIDHWIKMEPDPVPGGGGVYDDYKKNDEGFIVIKDPETKKEEILNKVVDPKYPAAPYVRWMDWSGVNGLIALSTGGSICIIKPREEQFKVLTPEVPRQSNLFRYYNTPTWSPDGKTILYTASGNKEEKGGLFIIDADGSNKHLLVENGMSGSWSPDGKQIVYQTVGRRATEEDIKKAGHYLYSTQDIHIINVDGTGKRLLVEGGANPAWSPNEKWILYHCYLGWFIITPDGLVKKKPKTPIDGNPPSWSKDGKKLLGEERGYIADFEILEGYDIK